MSYLFFENHPKCLKNVHLISGLSAGERDPLPLMRAINRVLCPEKLYLSYILRILETQDFNICVLLLRTWYTGIW